MNTRNLGILAAAAFSLAATGASNIKTEADPGFAPLFAVLLGGNEVSNAGEANVGDPDGRGSATVIVNPDSGTLCFATLVTGIDTPVAAHIHNALAGQNGPIAVTLTAPNSGDPGAASDLDPRLLKAIRQGPGAFYVNIHTDEFPDGALRGQLF